MRSIQDDKREDEKREEWIRGAFGMLFSWAPCTLYLESFGGYSSDGKL